MISVSSLLDHAYYLADECHYCVIPVRADGSKAPATDKWREYQSRRPSSEELRSWYGSDRVAGFGILQGRIAGREEGEAGVVVDIDDERLVEPFKKAVQSVAPGLIEKTAWVQSPNGYHFYARYEIGDEPPIPNVKLAMGVVDGKPKALIETRGEGGYVVGPYSPTQCHPTGREYKCQRGGATLLDMPRLTRDEINLLLDLARTFDELQPEELPRQQETSGQSARPGDDFNSRATWNDILEPHGWTSVGHAGGKELWRRPGKDAPGISATTGCMSKAGNDLLVVFSSNASPFSATKPDGRPGATHTKFAAYALLNHGGDFQSATRALGDAGYGATRLKPDRNPETPPVAAKPLVGWTLPSVAASWRARFTACEEPARFPTGMPFEWGPGSLLLLGAGPGAGKSTLAMQCVQDALLRDEKLRAIAVNVEMPPEDIYSRQLAVHSGVSYGHIRYTADLRDGERAQLDEADAELQHRIGDRLRYLTTSDYESIRLAVTECKADILVVDYLQRIRTSSAKASDKRIVVDAILHELREICLEGVGVLAISSLGRPQKKGDGYVDYDITAFKESGEIEYGADEAYILQRGIFIRGATPVTLNAVKLRHRPLEEGSIKLVQDASLRFRLVQPIPLFESDDDVDIEVIQ